MRGRPERCIEREGTIGCVRAFQRLARHPPASAVPAAERGDYDHVVGRTERVHGLDGPAAQYFGALLNSPPLAAALTRLGTAVRQGATRGTYTDAERELLDVALAVALGQNAILPIHIPDAIAVGVRPEAIEALLRGVDAELTPGERELVQYARDVDSCRVTDESYAAIERRFGRRGAIEVTGLVGFLLMTIRMWHALGVSEPSTDEMLDLLTDVREGRVEVPAPDARIG
jgi:4-carboxymuconolactone decarboxylase